MLTNKYCTCGCVAFDTKAAIKDQRKLYFQTWFENYKKAERLRRASDCPLATKRGVRFAKTREVPYRKKVFSG